MISPNYVDFPLAKCNIRLKPCECVRTRDEY